MVKMARKKLSFVSASRAAIILLKKASAGAPLRAVHTDDDDAFILFSFGS
jgi:hypothetical protein